MKRAQVRHAHRYTPQSLRVTVRRKEVWFSTVYHKAEGDEVRPSVQLTPKKARALAKWVLANVKE